MVYPVHILPAHTWPASLREIPEPPDSLTLRGTMPQSDAKRLAVVGSRNYTDYGKRAVEYLIAGLRGYPISIISGLALGIDALAHEAALQANLHTLAVPGSGLDDRVLYPRSNRGLALRILEAGGGLLSEFDPQFEATQWSFPKRNRIMVGLAHAVLVIEAREKSGTLITARLTAEYNRDLLVVPGSIFSENSVGAHQFLKLGATPITTPQDIVYALGFDPATAQNHTPSKTHSDTEALVLTLLREPQDQDTIIRALALSTGEALTLLMDMELRGLIREEHGMFMKQ